MRKTVFSPSHSALRIVVLVSGRGSNFQAIVDNIRAGKLPAVCAALITENPDAPCIERAKAAQVPVVVVNFRNYSSREEYEVDLLAALSELSPDLVVLAGYLLILGKKVVSTYKDKMINIHPSLLPAFPGLHAQEQALAYGVKIAGCTVHFVDEAMDTGPIILQRSVAVQDNDTADLLAERILAEEHIALSDAIQLFAEGRLTIHERRVIVS
jgi:phosphoribosylglycinamide formyltransferase-1